MHTTWLSLAALAVVLAISGGCDDGGGLVVQPDFDGGLQCAEGETARNGECYCQTDVACPPAYYCEAVTGTCQPKPPDGGTDGGEPPRPCVSGSRRCAPSPKRAVQECQQGVWNDLEVCPETGVCASSATGYYCTVCGPGATRCKTGAQNQIETCAEKGDLWSAEICPTDPSTGQPAPCVNSRCQVCQPNAIRCSADGTSLETCTADGSAWSPQFCIVTGRCQANACVRPFCMPGTRHCTGATGIEVCRTDGSAFEPKDCTTIDDYATSDAVCQADDCFDPCGKAGRESSYQGCDYWAAVTSNEQLDPAFTKLAQPTDLGTQVSTPSEFAIVVSNPNSTAVWVKVTRKEGAAEVKAPSDPAADAQGRISIPAGGLQIIRLPWQAVKRTGIAPFAYHLHSQLPISAYQFNPVTAKVGGGSFFDPAVYSFTNDASLLLPTHILGTSYVVLGQEHITIQAAQHPRCDAVQACPGFGDTCTGGRCDGDYTPPCETNDECPGPGNSCVGGLLGGSCSRMPTYPAPAFFSIVGVQDGTQVTVRFSATTPVSSGGASIIGAQIKGSTATYPLNRFDVLQFWTDVDGNPVECLLSSNYVFDNVCRYASDPTGTIVTSTKPVAIFSGADCTFKPFNKFACDHVEEQMVPFSSWGKKYVGARSVAYRDSSGRPVASPSPDYWRVTAGCGKNDCPSGTRFTIAPAPLSVVQSQYCSAGVCTLPPVDPAAGVKTAPWLEFVHGGDFSVSADQPVMLSQMFSGEEANPNSAEGDPSLVLTPPVEQWRSAYTVLTSPTMAHNYLSIAALSSSPEVKINGRDLNAINYPGMTSVSVAGGYTVFRVPVSGGTQTITATAKVGVTVSGYDTYVSYGYPGGLDLTRITQINPGG